MKVLRVIPSMDPASGGPCQGLRNIIPSLVEKGVQNEVVCLDDPGAAFIGKDPFIIYALGPSKTAWQYSERLLPWLFENIEKYDVVVLHGLWLYHGYALRKVIKELSKNKTKKRRHVPRFFVMPHGMLDPYFQKAGERKIKAIRNAIYWKLIERKIINEADGVLFTCEAEKELAGQSFNPYHPVKEINIGYGIQHPPAFNNTMVHAFQGKCPQVIGEQFLLFLSRIHEKKGVDHLLEAYEHVLVHTETQNKLLIPKLVIAGPGMDTAYGRQLQNIVDASPVLKHNVVFPGMLSGDAKWGAFYACDAFILPSHQENFGIAVVEALSCGKPVLISNQVNIWHEIAENNAGLVGDDTTGGVKQLMSSWIGMTEAAKVAMGVNALKCFENDYTIEEAVKRFQNLVVKMNAPLLQ